MHISTSKVKRYIGNFYEDAELMTSLKEFAIKEKIETGYFSIIGGAKKVQFTEYDFKNKIYLPPLEIAVDSEILTCTGNFSIYGNDVMVHAHITISIDHGKQVFGGHLVSCNLYLAEFYIEALPGANLVRQFDEKSGLKVWL